MLIQRALLSLGVLAAVLSVQVACSPPTRYRVLSFFFDDVPQPGVTPMVGYPSRMSIDGSPNAEARAVATARAENRAHPPYREHQCQRCHNFATGEIWRTAREGLCESCHKEVTKQHRYMHGPVAIRECQFCHHHHGSVHPHLFLDEPVKICQQCHKTEILLTCEFLGGDETRSCLDCHSGHGGDNRFFLKSSDP